MVNKKTVKIGLYLIGVPIAIIFLLGICFGIGVASNGSGDNLLSMVTWIGILLLSPIATIAMIGGGIVCIVGLTQDNR